MARNREKNPLWRRGLSSGLHGGIWAFNTYYGYPVLRTYGKYRSEKREWKRRNLFDVNKYWKANPQAKKFYEYNLKKNPEISRKLLNKIKSTSTIGKKSEIIDIFQFNSEGKLRGANKERFGEFFKKISLSKRRKVYTAVAGLGAGTYVFLRNKYKRRKK